MSPKPWHVLCKENEARLSSDSQQAFPDNRDVASSVGLSVVPARKDCPVSPEPQLTTEGGFSKGRAIKD